MDLTTLRNIQTLIVKQQFTLMINRYEVWAADAAGTPSALVGFAEQKRMTLREEVTLFTDRSKSAVLARFKARNVIDLGGAYDVTDGYGAAIGLFRKDFAASLLRSTWRIEQPGLPVVVTGSERSPFMALIRRFTDVSFLPYHFDFAADGVPAFSVDRTWAVRDTYLVRIADPRIDRRLVIAMSVALDALQSR